MRTNFKFYLFAVNNNGLGLKVRLPDLFCVALRKADIVAKLFSFACELAFVHYILLLYPAFTGSFRG